MPHLKRNGAIVLGVSTDSVTSHQQFADKYDFNFSLLADTEKKAIEKYSVWKEKNMYGKKSMGFVRSTFIIDEAGRIATIFPKVKVDGHYDQALEALKAL